MNENWQIRYLFHSHSINQKQLLIIEVNINVNDEKEPEKEIIKAQIKKSSSTTSPKVNHIFDTGNFLITNL